MGDGMEPFFLPAGGRHSAAGSRGGRGTVDRGRVLLYLVTFSLNTHVLFQPGPIVRSEDYHFRGVSRSTLEGEGRKECA